MDELIKEEAADTEVFLAQRVFNDQRKTLSMANLRPTAMSTNRKVIMPAPRLPKEEMELEVRKELWLK